ncbi:MAG: YdcF family protein [Clostridia bacterium]|nr:YdcF family protein [Clostridia bacterium]
MVTRWRLYILAVFAGLILLMLLGIRLLKKRGMEISFLQSLFFIVGVVLSVETAIIMRLSNYNLGVFLPAFFGLPLIFLAFCLPHMQHGFPAFFKWFIAGCYGVAVCIFLVCGALMLSAQHSAEETEADAVIVLGAAVHGTKVTWVLENRLNTAMELLEHNPEAICVVSGGQGPQEDCTEASAMRLYLIERGVDESRIYLEERAENTVGNFRYSKPIIEEALGPDARIAFVTTDFHVYRAGRVAVSQGVEAVGVAAPDVWYLRLNNFLRECVGICVYGLRGDLA